MTRRRRSQSGAALLLTIGVLASLVAILAAVASTQQVNMRAMSNRMAERRARLMAESGIQYALVNMENQTPNETSQNDDWYTVLGQTGAIKYTVADDSFRVQVIDAASLVNLNTATEAQLDKMPLTQEQIDSLLDWRSTGQTPRQDGGKDEYYNALTTPYNTKLAGLSTLDELLLVKGFSAKAIYEPQTENLVPTYTDLPAKDDGSEPSLYDLSTVDSVSSLAGANGQALPSITTATIPQLVQRGVPPQLATQIFNQRAQMTSYRALLSLPGMTTQAARSLVGAYSVGNATAATGRINVNTASEAVLETLPGITPDLASSLVSRQTTPMTSLGDLFSVPGFTVQIGAQALDSVATNSQRFIIRSMGTSGQVNVSLEATVSISTSGLQIIKISRSPYPDMSQRWSWDATAGSETVLKETSQQ